MFRNHFGHASEGGQQPMESKLPIKLIGVRLNPGFQLFLTGRFWNNDKSKTTFEPRNIILKHPAIRGKKAWEQDLSDSLTFQFRMPEIDYRQGIEFCLNVEVLQLQATLMVDDEVLYHHAWRALTQIRNHLHPRDFQRLKEVDEDFDKSED